MRNHTKYHARILTLVFIPDDLGTSLLQKKIHLQTYMKHIGYILFPIPDKLQTPKPIKYNTNRLKQTTCKTGVENAKTIISRTTI